jgi:hypothetical protein
MLLLFDQELQPHLKLINLSSSRVSMAGDSVAPSSIDSLFFLLASSRHLFFFVQRNIKIKDMPLLILLSVTANQYGQQLR